MTGEATSRNGAAGSAIAANDDGRPYGLRDVEGRTLMLEVRLRTGDRRAFPYAYLLEVAHDLSVGLRIRFTNASIKIAGRNLGDLYAALVAQRAMWIEEGMPELDFSPETAPFISAVALSGPSNSAVTGP